MGWWTRRLMAAVCALAVSSCGGGSGSGKGAGRCDFPVTVSTQATTYIASGLESCGPTSAADFGVDGGMAVSPEVYASGAACGSCFEVTGPTGTATAVITDTCPGCTGNQVDLQTAVASKVMSSGGTVNVTLRPIACDNAAQIKLTQESNPFHITMYISGHRTPIASVSMGGVPLPRQNYGAFDSDVAFDGAATYSVEVTDIFGETVSIPSVPPASGVVLTGAQFSACQ